MTGYIFGSGGGSGVDISDTTLLQNEALPGKYFYLANGQKVQGTMPVKEATIATPTASEQILVPAGTYAKGDQKIAGVKTQELTVNPSTEKQIITPPTGYYFNKVTANGLMRSWGYLSNAKNRPTSVTIPLEGINFILSGFVLFQVPVGEIDTDYTYVISVGIYGNYISTNSLEAKYVDSRGWIIRFCTDVFWSINNNDLKIYTEETSNCLFDINSQQLFYDIYGF